MKSAKEWVEEINIRLEDNHSKQPSRGNRYGITKIIRSIQADAIKSTEVNLRELEYNIRILREALSNCNDDEECEYDRNGFCQTHNCVEPCYNDVALQVLIAT